MATKKKETEEIKDIEQNQSDKKTVKKTAKSKKTDADVVITEIGGTIGDIESQPFLEAIRQVAVEKGRENVVYIHVPLIVQIPGSGELKSKPTQHSVKELLSLGIQPDVLVCRSDVPIPEDMRKKIALFCNISEDCVIQNTTADTLYEVPLLLQKEGLDEIVCRKLGLDRPAADMTHWAAMVSDIKNASREVTIALVGKYVQLHDAYLSVEESLFHAGTACGAVVHIRWVDSETVTAENAAEAAYAGTVEVYPVRDVPQLLAHLSGERLIETGLRHGTVTVLLDGLPLEITTYRVDGGYSDHRRPDSVTFTRSLRADLLRRDFTMNALAYNPRAGLVDVCGGAEDLARGVVRCVGEPERRFREDGLRILRALRFASVLGFTIEPETAAAIHRCAELLRYLAAERVLSELTKLLCGQNAGAVLREFSDVLAVPIPELRPMFGFAQHNPHHDRDVWQHTVAVVEHIPPEPVLRWAALLHDVGKPPCFSLADDGVGHFYGHAAKSTELADAILTRLRMDTAGRTRITQLIRYHDLPIAPEPKPIRRLMHKLGVEPVRQLFALHIADTCGQSAICAGRVQTYQEAGRVLDALLAADACFSLRDLAVNGSDLLALGLRGRAVGAALQACLDAVMDERVANERAALLAYAAENLHRFANS